ncbi:hypothetical protein BGZ99_010305, partial [Dissophora globulifera]
PPRRIVGPVGPGQESSSLKLDHWVTHKQDVSEKLMKNRASMMKYHETLQTVHEILLPGVTLRGNGDRFTCGDELDKELKLLDFSVTMECYRRALGKHYLVVVKVKPPTATQKELDDDHIKLPNLMKAPLDQQIAKDMGMWDAIYELRNVGRFQTVADHTRWRSFFRYAQCLLQ